MIHALTMITISLTTIVSTVLLLFSRYPSVALVTIFTGIIWLILEIVQNRYVASPSLVVFSIVSSVLIIFDTPPGAAAVVFGLAFTAWDLCRFKQRILVAGGLENSHLAASDHIKKLSLSVYPGLLLTIIAMNSTTVTINFYLLVATAGFALFIFYRALLLISK
ncbi:hypothetical protein QA601_16615 [Chitinispirillales bacterium ANBcel5]|uniref:hypothetical protein n=1 Tax=Cellulosispirillum alkaliphilum TaxID=3039283 RepID=UPI002A4EFF6C|nr:hypothetical protein [Chitinispirillales bacterium ANBcel5]